MPDTAQPIAFHPDEPEEHTRKLALTVQEILKGKTNNATNVTLTPNALETVVERDRVCCDTRVSLTAQTLSASQASGLWVETEHGKLTIHHDIDPATDREFGIILVG